MTFIHVTYAECLRVLCGNQGGTANFSFVPKPGAELFCVIGKCSYYIKNSIMGKYSCDIKKPSGVGAL